MPEIVIMGSVLFIVGGTFFGALGSVVQGGLYAGYSVLEILSWFVGIAIACGAVWGLVVVVMALLEVLHHATLLKKDSERATNGQETGLGQPQE